MSNHLITQASVDLNQHTRQFKRLTINDNANMTVLIHAFINDVEKVCNHFKILKIPFQKFKYISIPIVLVVYACIFCTIWVSKLFIIIIGICFFLLVGMLLSIYCYLPRLAKLYNSKATEVLEKYNNGPFQNFGIVAQILIKLSGSKVKFSLLFSFFQIHSTNPPIHLPTIPIECIDLNHDTCNEISQISVFNDDEEFNPHAHELSPARIISNKNNENRIKRDIKIFEASSNKKGSNEKDFYLINNILDTNIDQANPNSKSFETEYCLKSLTNNKETQFNKLSKSAIIGNKINNYEKIEIHSKAGKISEKVGDENESIAIKPK